MLQAQLKVELVLPSWKDDSLHPVSFVLIFKNQKCIVDRNHEKLLHLWVVWLVYWLIAQLVNAQDGHHNCLILSLQAASHPWCRADGGRHRPGLCG